MKIESPESCGVGNGQHCCAYLVMGKGFECGRASLGLKAALDKRILAKTMNAKYVPLAGVGFPECQPFSAAEHPTEEES